VRFRNLDVTAGKAEGKRVFFATDMPYAIRSSANTTHVFFEDEMGDAARPHQKKGDTFADIGSNWQSLHLRGRHSGSRSDHLHLSRTRQLPPADPQHDAERFGGCGEL
jgi:hypothetical protein